MFDIIQIIKRDGFEYFFRKVFRFPVRVFQWASILFNDEDWDIHYFLYIMMYKLERMENLFRYEGHHVNHIRDANRVRTIIEHIKRHIDIDKYVLKEDYDIWFEKTPSGNTTLVDNCSKRGKYLLKRADQLEDWHFKQAFLKMAKWGKTFWD